MNKVNRQRPFGAKDKWSYAMGDLGCNMSFAPEQLFDAVLYTVYWAGFRNMGNHYFAFENLGCD